MKNLKKLLCGALSLTMILALAACGSSSGGDHDDTGASGGDAPIIGISQYGQHGSLDNCREGFLQGLKEAGLEEGKDYQIDYQNASFDDNMAIQIAQAFSAEDAALMVGMNILPVNAVMGGFASVSVMQLLCCPTNTHNVWVTSYTGEEVTSVTKRLLPWIWPVVIVGVVVSAVMWM